MATQLEETDTELVVSTIQTVGRERRRPRGHVKVPKGDPKALRDEVIRQIDAARVRAGITPK